MSKTHFQLNKETTVGIVLLSAVVVLFFINVFFVIGAVIQVYGAKKTSQNTSAIDDSSLSQAVKFLNLTSSKE